ncbi:peroxidase 24-like [Punica granatum]|uniref:Peroxidase n=1 Tax=Punica granatum TaxID=22663 RepID=A0A6P8DQX5_PUNGR|nr:peroxidase 24-like [Punica granatum]
MNRSSFLVVFITVLLLPISTVPARTRQGKHVHHVNKNNGAGKLKLKFYQKSCPLADAIVRNITWSRVKADRTLAAKILRLQFHDCFVRGCDASILLDSVNGEAVEKNAIPNHSLSGYNVIDEIKSELEEKCPETVSCADNLALAARDAVSYQFGKTLWKVFTGRRDGRVSSASEVLSKIPGGASNFTTLQKQFSDNGLDVPDLVALSGAHTIGVARCVVISRRLFNFTGKGDTDPSLDPGYVKELKEKCANPPHNPTTTVVEFDPKSSLSFDSHYFVALSKHQGLLQSDATLLTNPTSASYVKAFQNFEDFMAQFGESMKKMGNIGVLTQNQGEIRKNCRVVN